jgi:hypothetical protein
VIFNDGFVDKIEGNVGQKNKTTQNINNVATLWVVHTSNASGTCPQCAGKNYKNYCD